MVRRWLVEQIFCRKIFWRAVSCAFQPNHVQLSRWALYIVSTCGNAKLHTETSPYGPIITGDGWFYTNFANEAVRTATCYYTVYIVVNSTHCFSWGDGWFCTIFANEAMRTAICKCIIRRLTYSKPEARAHFRRYPKQTTKWAYMITEGLVSRAYGDPLLRHHWRLT